MVETEARQIKGIMMIIIYIRQMNQQKKIKLIISSFKEKELIQFFQIYCEQYLSDLRKTTKKISFNCFQATLQHRHIVVNGYGKTYSQALATGSENFIEKLLQDQRNHANLRQSLKKFSLMFNISGLQQPSSEKLKTLPDNLHEKKVGYVSKAQDVALKPKENMMKSVKTIKEQIFESLNHENIQLRPAISSYPQQMHKNPSYSMLQHQPRNQQLSQVLTKIKQLEQNLAQAQLENQHLKNRVKQNDLKSINKHISSNSKLERYHLQEPKYSEKDSYLKDISNKFNNTSTTNDLPKDQNKMRSYSLSNSMNPSAFNSKVAPKIKIPKLNLEVLPNYHGKSNKSLNQSLLQSYQKKAKNIV